MNYIIWKAPLRVGYGLLILFLPNKVPDLEEMEDNSLLNEQKIDWSQTRRLPILVI